MTDMSTHMEHDQSNLFADLGSTPAVDPTAKGRSLGIGFYLAVAFIVLIVLAAILAPWLPLKDPGAVLRRGRRTAAVCAVVASSGSAPISCRVTCSAAPSGAPGSRSPSASSAIAFGMLVGGSLGMIAGYFRGRFNAIISFCFVILLSFPALVLAILITSLLDRSLFTISFTIGILAVAPVGMVSRATTVSFADREFVLGRTDARREAPAHHHARTASERRRSR